MVFWSTLRKKIKNAIQRREFDDLKNQVDDNTADIGNKANTSDVVLKSMTTTTTITNTGNTIVSAPIVNITSRTGDLEFRVNDTTKSITCGGARIVNVANPTVRNGVATKEYVDNNINTVNTAIGRKANSADVYLKSQTYTRAEIDNKDTTLRNSINAKADASSVYTKSQIDSRYYTTTESNNRYYTKSEIDRMHNFSVFVTNGNIRHKLDLGSGAFLYSVELDSIPSSTNNVWYETLEVQRDSGGGFYTYTPTQFVQGLKRYYFISNDSYTLNQRLSKVNIVYFNPGR